MRKPFAYKLLKKTLKGQITVEEYGKQLFDYFESWEPSVKVDKADRKVYLIKMYGKNCVFCNIEMIVTGSSNQNKLIAETELTIEHILPSSLGGPDHVENMCLSCGHCNNKKMNYLLPPVLYYRLKQNDKPKQKSKKYSLQDLINKYHGKSA